MNPCRVVIVLSVAALPLWGCGRAEETKRDVKPVALFRPTRWQAGDVLTRTATDTKTDRLTKVLPDGVVSVVRSSERVTNATWLEKCLGVDDDGGRARYLVYVREWSQRLGEVRDDTLQDAYVDVTRDHSGQQWSLVRSAKHPSDEARKWLDERFGPPRTDDEALIQFLLDDDAVRPLVLTDRPLAPGESWKPDLASLADAASKGKMDIDRAGITATATLVGVDDRTAHGLFEASLPLRSGPDDQPWTKGGALTVRIDAYYPPAGRLLVPSSVDRHVALEGQVNTQGMTLGLAGHSRETRRTTVGGDFPDPK